MLKLSGIRFVNTGCTAIVTANVSPKFSKGDFEAIPYPMLQS